MWVCGVLKQLTEMARPKLLFAPFFILTVSISCSGRDGSSVNMRQVQREQGHSPEVWGRGGEGKDGEEVTGDWWSLSPVWWWHREERRWRRRGRRGEGVPPPPPSQC